MNADSDTILKEIRELREETQGLRAMLATRELLSLADIAHTLGKTEPTVRKYLKFARRFKGSGRYTLDDQNAVLHEMQKPRERIKITRRKPKCAKQ